jgi:hypothetical protein
MPGTFLSNRRMVVIAALVLLVSTAGCGRRMYPVHGIVTLDDGRPLTRGMVIFEGQPEGVTVMARGQIQPDGSYQLGTEKPGDGVPPGKYRVQINPIDLSEVPDEKKNLPFDIKYLRFNTSGLEYEVKAGSNEFPIQLSRPAARRR